MIVAGLDGDFKRNQFGYLIDLIPMAEKVKKMSAVCFNCGDEASFTQRTKFSRSVDKTEQVHVGGSEMYKPVCRRCYMANMEQEEVNNNACAMGIMQQTTSTSQTVSPMKGSNDDTMVTSGSQPQQILTQESGKKRSIK